MKKLFATLLISCMTLSLLACGGETPDVQEDEAKVEATDDSSEPVVTPEAENTEEETTEASDETAEENAEVENVEAEAAVEESFAQANNITVIEVADGYSETFSFTEYNKKEDGTPDETLATQFNCPTVVNCDVVDNGDGTKTVTYVAEFDIRDWSLEFENYSSDTYLADIKTGKIFSSSSGTNEVTVNGETVTADYKFEDEYDSDYTKHTKNYILTCPVDYEDYALFISDSNYINPDNHYDSLADIVAVDAPYEKRVLIH